MAYVGSCRGLLQTLSKVCKTQTSSICPRHAPYLLLSQLEPGTSSSWPQFPGWPLEAHLSPACVMTTCGWLGASCLRSCPWGVSALRRLGQESRRMDLASWGVSALRLGQGSRVMDLASSTLRLPDFTCQAPTSSGSCPGTRVVPLWSSDSISSTGTGPALRRCWLNRHGKVNSGCAE